jgi:hypothetical protein
MDPLFAIGARIYWKGGLWFGDARIATSKMSDVQKAAVALGGLFAEARAAAENTARHSESLDENRHVESGKRLTDEVDRVVGVALETRVRSIMSQVPIAGAPGEAISQVSSLSLEDIQYIPDSILDDAKSLRDAIKMALVINDNDEWAFIQTFTDTLVAREPDWVEDLPNLRHGASL